MKPKLLIAALLAALLVGLVAAGWWWYERQHRPASDILVLHGNVDIRQVELAFNASDRIDQVLVREGERVTAGQLLAVLDSRRLRHAADQAQAQVAAQREIVARYVAGSRPEEIRKAQADVEAARADAINAEQTYRRTVELVAQHFVAQQQADNAKAALDAAHARLKAAEEALRLAVVGPRKEDIAAAEATLAAYQAAPARSRSAISPRHRCTRLPKA